jgi:hypothetical protein
MSTPAQAAAFRDGLRRLEGLRFVVAGGTALGLHRDGDLIDTDTDVDFVCPVSEQAEALARFEGSARRYQREWGGVLYQTGWLLVGYPVDVHFYVPGPDESYVCRHEVNSESVRLVFPRAALDAPEWRTTRYGPVPLPGDVEGYLERKYGADWRVPQYRKKGLFLRDDGTTIQRVVRR